MKEYELTAQEYKKLVMDLTVAIAPLLLKETKDTSDIAGERISKYAIDIATGVKDTITESHFG